MSRSSCSDGEGSAIVRRSASECCSGSCRGTSRTTRWPALPGRTSIGNTILLKHAPQCPSRRRDREDVRRRGLPRGRLHQHLRGQRADRVGDRGSARARRVGHRLGAGGRGGRRNGRASNLKKVVLELGGSDPSSSWHRRSRRDGRGRRSRPASTTPASHATRRSGSSCIDELYEPFLEKFTAAMTAVKPGDPTSADTTIGPLSSSTAADRLESRSAARSLRVPKWRPAASATATSSRPRCSRRSRRTTRPRREEFFGPVAQVYSVSSEDEAVKLANDTRFGLGSYLMTTDPEQADRVANKIEAGMVYVNIVGADGAELPFGGVKALRLRSRARQLRCRRVRQQETDSRRLILLPRVQVAMPDQSSGLHLGPGEPAAVRS